MQEEDLTRLLGIPGFRVMRVELEARGERTTAIVHLARTTPGYICGRCQQQVAAAYDSREQEVQHLVACPPWGVVTEALPFVARYAWITMALAALQAFRNSVKVPCQGVQIIYDKCHGIQHLLKALNEVAKSPRPRAPSPEDPPGAQPLPVESLPAQRDLWATLVLYQAGPPRLHRGHQSQSEEYHPTSLWISGQRVHEAQAHPGVLLQRDLPSLGLHPHSSVMSQ